MILEFLFQKLTEENPPEIIVDKCINSYNNNKCNTCTECCPEHAITIKEKDIKVNEKICSECGICKSVCPSKAIKMKGKEEEILKAANEKRNLVFSCSLGSATGNLYVGCLNAINPEYIAALFILYKEKKFYFNLSNCDNCKLGYSNNIFKESLNKAISFVNSFGILPKYEFLIDEENIDDLITEEISRRNLFKLVKNESENILIKTVSTIIDNNDLSNRKLLLSAVQTLQFEKENKLSDVFWSNWNVSTECDGCGKCATICPSKSWKIEKSNVSIKLYHSVGNCYNCGLCKSICHKNAITKSDIKNSENRNFSDYVIKMEIGLNTCSICNKEFIPTNNEEEKCDVCKKKELLRKKISTSLS